MDEKGVKTPRTEKGKSLLLTVPLDHHCERLNLIAKLKNISNAIKHTSRNRKIPQLKESFTPKDPVVSATKQSDGASSKPCQKLKEKPLKDQKRLDKKLKAHNEPVNKRFKGNINESVSSQKICNRCGMVCPVGAPQVQKVGLVKEKSYRFINKYSKFAQKYYNVMSCDLKPVPCWRHKNFVRKTLKRTAATQTPAGLGDLDGREPRIPCDCLEKKKSEVIEEEKCDPRSINYKIALSEGIRKKIPAFLLSQVGSFGPPRPLVPKEKKRHHPSICNCKDCIWKKLERDSMLESKLLPSTSDGSLTSKTSMELDHDHDWTKLESAGSIGPLETTPERMMEVVEGEGMEE